MTKTAPSCRCGSWYRDNELERVFRNTLDGAGTPYTGISPPAGLAGCPLCLRRLTASLDRFNARTETGQSYLPDMRHHAPRPATACLCADGCSPYTSLLKVGSWPAHSRTAFLSDAYRTYQWTYSIIELSPARTGPPERRRACADWRRCRKSPHFDVHFRKIIIFQQAAFFAHCACFLIKSGANSVKIQSIPVDNGRLQSA